MNLQELFEEAWTKSSTNRVTREEAMNWFYEGVGAQKKAQPQVRMADAEEFAKLRKPRDIPAYREEGIGIEEVRRRFFLDLVRQYNLMLNVTVAPSDEQVIMACEALAMMSEAGAKLDPWMINNMMAGRTRKYEDYKGFTQFRQIVEALYHNALV